MKKYIGIVGVCELLSIDRRTLERMRKHNFPTPNFWIGKSPRWEEGELVEQLKEIKYLKVK